MQLGNINLGGVSKWYGPTRVLNQITMSVEAGEFLILLGPSGCGKSTLLRMIAGLETITDGELCIDGRLSNDVHPRDRDIAMVFQNYALYPHMSVQENIAYPLRIAQTDKAAIKKQVEEVAQLLELTNYLDRKPADLSGGQRQRVAMGRAIIRRPAVFLMDEPLSNLDARLRQQMRIEIRELQKRLGVTMVYVTHDQVEAMTMADRIAVMNGGEIQQIGTAAEIYNKPANLFVAEFMGSPPTNLLHDPDLIKVLAEPEHYRAGDLIAGVRPEHIVYGDSSCGHYVVLSAFCVAVESLGSETLCHLELRSDKPTDSDEKFTDVTKMTARWSGDHTALINKKILISISRENVLYFDRSDGQLVGV